jgi:hypothetical protein
MVTNGLMEEECLHLHGSGPPLTDADSVALLIARLETALRDTPSPVSLDLESNSGVAATASCGWGPSEARLHDGGIVYIRCPVVEEEGQIWDMWQWDVEITISDAASFRFSARDPDIVVHDGHRWVRLITG